MTAKGTENAGRAWLVAKVVANSNMKDAVKAIAKLNRTKKPAQPGPAEGWYIVRADELEDAGELMIVVDADKPTSLADAVAKLEALPELVIDTQYKVKVEQQPDGTWKTFHHPKKPHQGEWDEVEKPENLDSSSHGGPNVSDPEKTASPRPNPRNPWG